MKQLIKTWEDTSTVIEEMKRIEKEYQDQGYKTSRTMVTVRLFLEDGAVDIYWKDGAIWQEVIEEENPFSDQ